MENLHRPIQMKFRVTARERDFIKERMAQAGMHTLSRYLRAMALNGCIIRPDNSDLKQVDYELHKIGVNINQIAKKANETGNIYAKDIEQLQEMMDSIWQLQKYILSNAP